MCTGQTSEACIPAREEYHPSRVLITQSGWNPIVTIVIAKKLKGASVDLIIPSFSQELQENWRLARELGPKAFLAYVNLARGCIYNVKTIFFFLVNFCFLLIFDIMRYNPSSLSHSALMIFLLIVFNNCFDFWIFFYLFLLICK